MEDLLNMWGLEYSFSENGFFSAPLKELIKMNKESLRHGNQHDFILIDIFESKEDAEAVSDIWTKRANAKIFFRDINGNLNVKP